MGFGNLSTRKVIDLLYIGSSRGIVLSCVAVAHIKKDSRQDKRSYSALASNSKLQTPKTYSQVIHSPAVCLAGARELQAWIYQLLKLQTPNHYILYIPASLASCRPGSNFLCWNLGVKKGGTFVPPI